MRLQTPITSSAVRSLLASACLYCPHCADPMIAPAVSEFVEAHGDQGIRHRWICESCGAETATIIPLTRK
jgi:hypothetical protein